MDRRTKFILFLILALAVFGLVGWFIVWPTVKPFIPAPAQPPALNTPTPPVFTGGSGQPAGEVPSGSGSATFDPGAGNPDALVIAEMERRASILSERVESGSSQDGFTNLDDAQLDVSPTLANTFRTIKADLRKRYPAAGTSYVTAARSLSTKPESDQITGSTFKISVQMLVETRDNGMASVAYRESTVTFTNSSGNWITSGYVAAPFTP